MSIPQAMALLKADQDGVTASSPKDLQAASLIKLMLIAPCLQLHSQEAPFNNLRCSRSFLGRKPNKNHTIESLAFSCDVMGDSKEQRFRIKVVK